MSARRRILEASIGLSGGPGKKWLVILKCGHVAHVTVTRPADDDPWIVYLPNYAATCRECSPKPHAQKGRGK